MLKRVASLTFVAAFAVLAFGAPAETARIEDGQADCGGTFAVTISIDDSANLNTFGITITHDETCLEFVSGVRGTVTQGWTQFGVQAGQDGKTAVFGLTTGPAHSGGGTLAEITYRCLTDACPCSSDLVLGDATIGLAGYTLVHGSAQCGEGVPTGDVNGDGRITPADAQAVFDCYSDGACAPGIDSTEGDVCRIEGSPGLTPLDAQGLFRMYLGQDPGC